MAKRTISTRLAVEGESEYKKGIASCNSELSTLKSNLALTESAFKGQANTISALSAKGDALSAMYEKQKQKVGALEAALANAQAAQAGYSDRVAMAKENIERCEKALETLKDSTGDTSEEQAALTAELEKWNSELEEAKAYQEAAEKGVNGWQKQLNYANVDLNNLSAEIAKNNQYLDEAKKSADGCAKSIDQYGKETEEAANKSKKFGDKSKNAVDSLASALAAAGITATVKEIGQTLLECSDAAARFEAAIAKIATIADTSKMSLEDISSEIITLSGKTAQSSVALSEAVYSAISAGVDTAHAVEFVEKATRLAAGGFTESQTAVDVLTTALNAYGLSVAETERVSDILITTQNLGKTTVNELAASVGKVIPLAAAYGVEMDNLGAAYAVLTANGVATAEAGTYLKAILNELGNSGSTVAKVLKEQTGTSFAGLVANGSSLGDVLDILGQSVEGDATAFNELWSSTEAGVGALSIFNKGADNFNAVLGEMQDSAGATSDAWAALWLGMDVQMLDGGGCPWKRDIKEDSDMKFLKVTSGKCEVFTAPDVNAVDKHYNGGKLTEGVCYPVQAEVGSSGGYSWVRIFVAGVQRYAAVLADRCRLVTLSPGDAFAACVAQGGDAAGQRAQRDGRQAGAYAQRTEASGTAPGV